MVTCGNCFPIKIYLYIYIYKLNWKNPFSENKISFKLILKKLGSKGRIGGLTQPSKNAQGKPRLEMYLVGLPAFYFGNHQAPTP